MTLCMPQATQPQSLRPNRKELMIDPYVHRVGGQLRPTEKHNEVLNDA